MSYTLYFHLANALQAIAHEQMKSMRTSKEHVDAPWRCRKSLSSDADYAERKLSKMGPDNKNLQAQMDHTNNLRRDPILGMDIISAEEVNLGDYKRPTAKMWLAIMTDSGMLRQGNCAYQSGTLTQWVDIFPSWLLAASTASG